MKNEFALKKDRFKKNRGGYSRFLLLCCEKCKNQIALYQKDGPGILKRLYFDRIFAPKDLKTDENLICKKCKAVVGVPMVYEKEKRLAFRLFAGAIEKKIVKSEQLEKIKL